MTPLRSGGCERARAYVSLELDGELSRFEQAILGSHLARCGSCRSYRTEVTAVTARLRSEPPLQLERPIMLPRPRRALVNVQVPASVAAAVMLAVGVGSLVATLSTERTAAPANNGPAYLQSPERELRMLEPPGDNRVPGAI